MLQLVPTHPPVEGLPPLDEVYRQEARFVWRTARYLGIPESQVEDVVHDVFIVVVRRRADFDPAYSVRSWLAGITRHVALHHKRSRARAQRKLHAVPTPESSDLSPDELLSRRQAANLLQEFLQTLHPAKRDVFVLMQLEGLTAPEAAKALGVKLNTVYSRLRAARRAFEKTVARLEKKRKREDG